MAAITYDQAKRRVFDGVDAFPCPNCFRPHVPPPATTERTVRRPAEMGGFYQINCQCGVSTVVKLAGVCRGMVKFTIWEEDHHWTRSRCEQLKALGIVPQNCNDLRYMLALSAWMELGVPNK